MDLSRLFPDHPTPPAAAPAVSLDVSPAHCLPLLHDAVCRADEKTYFRLVDYGADPLARLPPIEHDDPFEEEWSSYHPEDGLLFTAIQRCCVRIVQDLLARGEDPNQSSSSLKTPLFCWALAPVERFSAQDCADWERCAQLLLEHGADPHAPLPRFRPHGVPASLMAFLEARADEYGAALRFLRCTVEHQALQAHTPAVQNKHRRRF